GEHQNAIQTILIKDAKKPDQYETLANLGTFYNLHPDEIAKGLPYIERAIKINPNAHFGREVYQKYVVEYVVEHMKSGQIAFPIESGDINPGKAYGFKRYLFEKRGVVNDSVKAEEETNAAVKGVLGMMRFANHENPILLEALGDLLVGGGDQEAKLLAARAYL